MFFSYPFLFTCFLALVLFILSFNLKKTIENEEIRKLKIKLKNETHDDKNYINEFVFNNYFDPLNHIINSKLDKDIIYLHHMDKHVHCETLNKNNKNRRLKYKYFDKATFLANTWLLGSYCINEEILDCNLFSNDLVYLKQKKCWKCIPKYPSIFDKEGNILSQVCNGTGQVFYLDIDGNEIKIDKNVVEPFRKLPANNKQVSQIFYCKDVDSFVDNLNNKMIPRFSPNKLFFMQNFCTSLIYGADTDTIYIDWKEGTCVSTDKLYPHLNNEDSLPFNPCEGLKTMQNSLTNQEQIINYDVQGNNIGVGISIPCFDDFFTPQVLWPIIKYPCGFASQILENPEFCLKGSLLATNTLTPLALSYISK